jgi:hypothetical protein
MLSCCRLCVCALLLQVTTYIMMWQAWQVLVTLNCQQLRWQTWRR